MKILTFDSLDSTSAHAARLLDQDAMQAPFAVISRTQTAGRGRSGKSWDSPEGGLYLTMVLPSLPKGVQKNNLLPLWVAAVTASWLQKQFSFRCTIKWPNDLLFAGEKLAGILCESRVQGQSFGPFLIGIGINLHDAPDVPEQKTTSIDAIQGYVIKEDALRLGESLIAAFQKAAENSNWKKIYEAYALESGQLWRDADGQLAMLLGIDDDGALQLQRMSTGEKESLNSISHSYRWLPQVDPDAPMIVADIGNTLGKIAVFENGRMSPLFRLNLLQARADEKAEFQKFLSEHQVSRNWPVFAISVSDRASGELRLLLDGLGLTLHPVPKRPLRVNFDAYEFAELGIDRTAMVEAAEAYKPRQGKILVSAGTCVTVEVVDAQRRYLGGYILPGLQTKLNSLHLRTDRLPALKITELEPQKKVDLLGHDTRSAMLHGIVQETVLTLRGLEAELEKRYPDQDWTFLFTGGDAPILAHMMDAEALPDLILRGIRQMVLGGLPRSAAFC